MNELEKRHPGERVEGVRKSVCGISLIEGPFALWEIEMHRVISLQTLLQDEVVDGSGGASSGEGRGEDYPDIVE